MKISNKYFYFRIEFIKFRKGYLPKLNHDNGVKYSSLWWYAQFFTLCFIPRITKKGTLQ